MILTIPEGLGGGGRHLLLSLGRDMPPKRVEFLWSVYDRGIFHNIQIQGRGSNVPVWKRVTACLERGC